MIYLDHAATAHQRPLEVRKAMLAFLDRVSANPGRSAHRLSVAAAEILYEAREAVAELVGAADPLRVVFGLNGTEAVNLALRGVLVPGDHVVTSGMEHNAVMRPLRALETQGVAVTVVPCSSVGELGVDAVEAALRPSTRMIVMNHASNVTGTVLPVVEVARLAGRRDILLLVDGAQTAGAWPIHVDSDGIDLFAFTGHKSLLGPPGTGGLVLGPRVDPARLTPLKFGGTGSLSEHEAQPEFLPDRFESGTPNAVGLAGLAAAVRWILARSVEWIRDHEAVLTRRLVDGLTGIEGVTVYGSPGCAEMQTATVSFNVEGWSPSQAGQQLDEQHGILCRVGLHCAPAAHRTLGTFPHGTVRFGLGVFNTADEVDRAVAAVSALARSRP